MFNHSHAKDCALSVSTLQNKNCLLNCACPDHAVLEHCSRSGAAAKGTMHMLKTGFPMNGSLYPVGGITLTKRI